MSEADKPLSQEDIDAALAGLGSETPSAPTPAPTGGAAAAEDAAGFSQDDIDALLAQAGDLAGSVPEAAPSAAAPVASPVADGRLDSSGRPYDEFAAAMAEAIAEEKSGADPMPMAAPPSGSQPMAMPDFGGGGRLPEPTQPIDLLRDVDLDVKIELGRSRMLLEDVLRLGEGSVVELDKLAGDPVDVYVNDRLVARGEVLVLNDNFCVRVNEIISDVSREFQTA
ncbi:MAG: hypothetical protein HJJLKODD_01837 [Phycisphaerae bacterium]|nr:hypothetical protein [Phycisphaerae bacterium]